MQLSKVVQILPDVPFRTRIEGAARIVALPSSARGLLKPGGVVLQPRGNRYSVGK